MKGALPIGAERVKAVAAHLARISLTIAAILQHIAKRGKATRGRVHDLRRAARRGDVAVRLLSGEPGDAKDLRRVLRRLRHLAGDVRDLDVARDLLEPARSSSARWLVRQISDVRRDREKDLVRFARRKPRGGVVARTQRFLKRHSAAPAAVARALLAMEARLKTPATLAPTDEADAHAFRIACKRVVVAWDALGVHARQSRRLASIVRTLGKAHDLGVTADFIDAVIDRAGDKAPAGARDIAERLRAKSRSGPNRPHLL